MKKDREKETWGIRRSLLLLAKTGCLTILIWNTPINAQTEIGEVSIELEELIVTARKRTESLQDVPLSVTSIDQKAIENAFAETISEFEKYVPNVKLESIEFAGQALGATIRGVGFSDVEKTFEPAVGVSIDGVFLGASTGAAIDVFDLEQIEVLRGPQGTLYGRNTIGGVVNLKRTRPTEESGLRLKVRAGNNGQQSVLAVGNTGQMGTVAVKGYVFDKESETYATNIVTGAPDDVDDNIAYGFAALFSGDTVEALVSVDVFDDKSGAEAVYNLTVPTNGPGQNFFLTGTGNFCDLSRDGVLIGLVDPSTSTFGCAESSIGLAEDSDFELFARDIPQENFIEGSSASAEFNWRLNDDYQVISITAYRETDESFRAATSGRSIVFGPSAGPAQGASVPIFYSSIAQEYEQLSQELRIDGRVNDNLNIVAGLFAMKTELNRGNSTFVDGVTPGNQFVLGSAVNANDINQELTAVAAFVDGTYQFNDEWAFSGGLRYTKEEKDYRQTFIVNGDPTVIGTTASTSADFSAVTGRAILEYNLSEDIMFYGSWSRGFRSGGFNGRAVSPSAIGPYDEEFVDSIELGMRAEFFDNRLRLNPTIFSSTYDDKQEEVTRATAAGALETVVQNAASVDIKGFELELLAAITSKFTVRGSLGYLDAEYDSFIGRDFSLLDPSNPNFIPGATPLTLPIEDLSSRRALRRAPESTFSLGGEYVTTVFGDKLLTASVNYSFQDEFAGNLIPDQTSLNRHIIDDYDSTDFVLRLQSMNDAGMNWSVAAYINDAFDDDAGRVSAAIDAGPFYFAPSVATKTYGIDVELEF